MALLLEIAERRSCLRFDGRPIDPSKLDQIVEAGRLAPSAKNRQEWRFFVIRKADLRDKLADYLMPNGQYSYPIDLAVAAALMALQAEAEGLRSCFVTAFDEQEVKDLLSVPHRMRVVVLLALGYCAGPTPPKSRKPLRQIVSYDHW